MAGIYLFFVVECVMKVRASKHDSHSKSSAHACDNVKPIKVRTRVVVDLLLTNHLHTPDKINLLGFSRYVLGSHPTEQMF